MNDVIDDCEELEEYANSCVQDEDRQALLDGKPAPKFEREKVVAVAIGERPTAGYEVEIVCATQQTGGFVGLSTIISYTVRTPSGPVAQVLTHPHHVVRVKNAGGVIVFRQIPDATTLAVGEEGPTTLAIGEEDRWLATMAIGENDQRLTTMAVGEEGPPLTTMAIGEEGGAPTGMAGEDGRGATTLATGEEGPGPTTLATGEESNGGFGGPFGQY